MKGLTDNGGEGLRTMGSPCWDNQKGFLVGEGGLWLGLEGRVAFIARCQAQ